MPQTSSQVKTGTRRRNLRQIVEKPAPARLVESPAAGGVRTMAATWLALAVCALGAGGCQDDQGPQGKLALTPLQDVAEFNREVVQSRQPVLVDFYKDSCPTCVIQDDVLEGLNYEYQGRVKFVKFKVREAYMVSNCPEFMDQQKLFWVPTAVLFVNGKEQQRWELNHGAWEFRAALDAAGGRPPNAGPTVAQKGDKLAAKPVVGPDGCIEGQGCPIDRPPPATVGKSNGAGDGTKGPLVP